MSQEQEEISLPTCKKCGKELDEIYIAISGEDHWNWNGESYEVNNEAESLAWDKITCGYCGEPLTEEQKEFLKENR